MLSFWQTDKALSPRINSFGCAALDSLYLMPQDYYPEQVNEIIERSIRNGLLDENCTILSWARWLGSLGDDRAPLPGYPLQFSRKTSSQDYRCEPDEREIIKWYLSNVKENHFTVGDGIGNTLWDSMNRPDIMAKYATFVEKVIVRYEP